MNKLWRSPIRDEPAVRDSTFMRNLRPLTIIGRTDVEYDLLIKAFLAFALTGALVLVVL